MRGIAESHPFPVKDRYGFGGIDIGETITIYCGNTKALRTAASMYGTRYGVWLSVRQCEGGATVTRLEVPPGELKVNGKASGKPRREHIAGMTGDQLRQLNEHFRSLTGLVLGITERLRSIEEKL